MKSKVFKKGFARTHYRSGYHPREFLKNFSCTIVTDGYQVYRKLAAEREYPKVSGCWIHAKRPLADFINSVALKTAKGTVVREAYDMIADILHTDNEFDDLSDTDSKKQRHAKHQEKIDAYFGSVPLPSAEKTSFP